MAALPSAQDVADALAMTLEREDASGAPWCPPGDGAALRRWVCNRSASLGTGIRRAVRLARLLAISDGRDYLRFLYVRLPTLRARHFRHALETAAVDGRLPPSFATLSDSGVNLHEAALALRTGTHDVFEIDFAQMPRLGALLDFLHNALGFTAVADLLAPLFQRGAPAGHVDDVARALQAALNAWLRERLESPVHMLQARRIRAFLASRGRVAPESVDDEGILLFWTTMAEAPLDEQIDGFRLYRSVAAAMLRYRRALRDAAAARQLEAALERGYEPANDEIAANEAEARMESWHSPLKALVLPPADRVKWLNGREQHALLNYLGGPAGDGSENPEGENEPNDWKEGLGGEGRFELAFWLTLLRADVFGAAQASIVARLRKRVTGSEAIAQAMAQVDNAAYPAAAAIYSELRQQLRLESLAALAVLMEAGAVPEAVILLDGLGGRETLAAVIGATAANKSPVEGLEAGELEEREEALGDELGRAIAPTLQAAISDPSAMPDGPGRKLLLEALAAARKVSRAGFRREDRVDADMVAALRSGAAVVFEVIRELDRLVAVLSHKAQAADLAGDRARFLATFRTIYGSAGPA